MKVLHERCCGLDVHKKSIVACIITPEGKEIRSFGTMTDDLLGLVEWIQSKECTAVAMESTGVYWKPIYNLLEVAEIQAWVVNAQHMRTLPGRKSDVKDAEWIADLMQHGLLKNSYIPSREQRELRELVRYRRSLIEERSREINRVQKVLEGANIKLSSVVSNVMGVASRSLLEGLLQGKKSPEELAQKSIGRLKCQPAELEKALKGMMGNHQRMMISTQLRHIDYLSRVIGELDQEVQSRMAKDQELIDLLDTIPGIGQQSAQQILAEIGTDMDRFPTDAHLVSWAGMAPGQNESAGKRKSSKTRKGNKYLRSTLTEAGKSASRKKNSFFSSMYPRIAARRGKNRATLALGRHILVIAYHIIRNREPYRELGADYHDKQRKQTIVNRSIKKLESLGYTVSIKEQVS